MSGFPSTCCFGLFGDAALSGYSVIVQMFRKVTQHEWMYYGCVLKSMQVWELIVEAFKG